MYKFRGKRIDNEEWVEGYYYKGYRYTSYTEKASFILEDSDDCYATEVHPETVGMCLNKPDKNGNIAYVGDRVHDENYGDGEIKYDADKGLYYIKFYEDLDHDLRALSWLEIIGNIHDQP